MHEGEGGEMSATRRAVADSTATSSRKGVQMEEQTGRREKGWRERDGGSLRASQAIFILQFRHFQRENHQCHQQNVS